MTNLEGVAEELAVGRVAAELQVKHHWWGNHDEEEEQKSPSAPGPSTKCLCGRENRTAPGDRQGRILKGLPLTDGEENTQRGPDKVRQYV